MYCDTIFHTNQSSSTIATITMKLINNREATKKENSQLKILQRTSEFIFRRQ